MLLVVSSYGDEVNPVPLRRALWEHPDGSVMMFGMKPAGRVLLTRVRPAERDSCTASGPGKSC